MVKKKPARNFLDIPLLHPFLLALLPVISLWMTNADQVALFTLARPVAYSLAAALIAVVVGLILYRKVGKAAVFASIFLILFFSYGHIFNLIDMKSILGFVVGRHRFMVPLWLLLILACGLLIWNARSNLAPLNRTFNLICLLLAGIQLAQVGFTLFRAPKPAVSAAAQAANNPQPAARKMYPDIYLIVLDGYTREDVLAEQHGINIHPFVQELRDLGFMVLDCGQSNYPNTPFSIASTLNMNYLDALGAPIDPSAARIAYEDYTALIGHSLVREKLKALGYRFEFFKPLYPWMDIKDSDDYFDVEKSSSFFDRQESIEFQYLFLRTTLMRVVIETEEQSPDFFNRLPPWLVEILNPKAKLLSTRNLKQRDQNLYALQTLSTAAMLPGPKFFYAHLFITHPPYMFKPDGSLRWPVTQNTAGYDDQILYINTRLPEVIKNILASSKIPPVIILQADHGYPASTGENRVKILDAYYLPDGGADHLYPTMTPVNTFRLIFNQYFGESYPLLEDKSFIVPGEKPYQFQLVSNKCSRN